MAGKVKYILTPEIEALLRAEYDGKKATAARIAQQIGWTENQVRVHARRLGLTRPPGGRSRVHDFTDDDWAVFEELYDGTSASIETIKQRLKWDAAEGTVRAWAVKKGFSDPANRVRQCQARKIVADDKDRKIIHGMWVSYDSIPAILERLPHLNQSAIIEAAQDMGIMDRGRHQERVGQRKYFPTEAELDIIRARYDGQAGSLDGIMEALEDKYPRWWVKRTAAKLGLTCQNPLRTGPGQPWSEREEKLLTKLYPILSLCGIRAELKKVNGGISRSDTAIRIKAKRRAVTKRSSGFTLVQVCALFGEDHKKIRAWVQRGWLLGQRKNTARGPECGGDMWHFEEAYVRVFIINHYDKIDFRRVEKQAFVQLLAGTDGRTEAQPNEAAATTDEPQTYATPDGQTIKRLPPKTGRDGQRRRVRYHKSFQNIKKTVFDESYTPPRVD